jgi:hypothetical protein
MGRIGAVLHAGVRAFDAARLLLPLRVPGLPPIPRLLAYPALLEPRLVPYFLRWQGASGGLGLVVSRLCVQESRSSVDDAEGAGSTSVGRTLQSIGEEHGRALRSQLRYGRDPLECARAVALANRLFGIKAQVVRGSFGEARVVTPGCPWSRNLEWGTGPCGAFSRYEAGLTAGLNPGIRLRYESKKTRGDERCVGVYSWRSVAADR